jgi:PKHD-type hydroxylase
MIHYTNIHNNFSVSDTLESGAITNESGAVKRNSKVSFIKDVEICREIFNIINHTISINLTDIEPLQYSEYGVDDEYGWHRDVHDEPYSNGLVRKVSFSTILNDDFWGGEFDIETKNPMYKKRYQTFESEEYNTIIFPAHMWHRVRPVKSGIRKSIVGWLLGEP